MHETLKCIRESMKRMELFEILTETTLMNPKEKSIRYFHKYLRYMKKKMCENSWNDEDAS